MKSKVFIKENDKYVKVSNQSKKNKFVESHAIAMQHDTFSTDKFNMLLISDTHVRSGIDGNPDDSLAVDGSRVYYSSPSNIRDYVDLCNYLGDIDLAMHLGDMTDSPIDLTSVVSYFSEIDTETYLIPGNHDMGAISYNDLVAQLNHTEIPELGGSKFNTTFSLLNKGVDARVFIIDGNFDASGNHVAANPGRFSDSTLTWIQDVIDDATENNFIFFMHIIPHLYEISYFDTTSKDQFKTMIDLAKVSNPSLKVICIGGHHHQLEITSYDNISGIDGYLMPVCIESEKGNATKLTLNEYGELIFKVYKLQYYYA